jgi:small subunit ribosomal protein S4
MQARQLVNHGHLNVNGRRVDIASYRVKTSDVISVRDTATSKALSTRYLMENPRFSGADWITVDKQALTITVDRMPQPDEIQRVANEQLIVELYSR